jgi:CBS domain containing-hemolysin-like protein
MNDRSSQPASTIQPEAGDQRSDTDMDSAEKQAPTGRELVVIDRDERLDGWFTRFMIRLGLRSGGTLRDDLHEALSRDGEAGDVFSPEERAMLQNILRLRERRVEDVMVQRAEVHAVSLDDTLAEVLREFEDTGHSRLPVYNDTLDDPRGMVLIKDLLLHMTKLAKPKRNGRGSKKTAAVTPELDLSRVDLSAKLSHLDVMRKVLFVPPSMLASDLMARMQATRTQMALVIDEYGGTDGLVSLEDIVEEVVGEIEDEHDDEDEENRIDALGDGVWTVDARVEVEKLKEQIGATFEPGESAEDVDSLGGLVFALAGHVPVRGEVVRGVPGFEFRVLDADPRRIRRLQVVQISQRDKRRKTAAKIAEETNP